MSEVELVTLTEVPTLVPKSTAGRARDEPGAGDRDDVGPGLGPVVRVDGGDRRRRVVGELVTRRVDRRGAVGGGHRDVDRAGPRRGDDREGGAQLITLIEVPGLRPEVDAVAPVKPVPVTVTAWSRPLGPTGRADAGDRRAPGRCR